MTSVDGAVAGVVAVKQAALSSEIAVAVATKQQQATRQQGDAVVQLVEAAAQVGKAVGKGAGIDAHA